MTNAELISMVRSIAKHGADWRMFQSFVIDNSRDEVPYDKNTFYCADGERKDGK